MNQDPKIPMRLEDVPQQRIHVVADLPPRPPSFRGQCDYVTEMPENRRPKGSPRNVTYVGSVEWAWSPMHSRLDSYYLNRRRSHWLLWDRYQDEIDWNRRWRWVLYGYGPAPGVSPEQAAVYLLMDAWQHEATESSLDHYGWINEAGLLSIGEITAIARLVWPEAYSG